MDRSFSEVVISLITDRKMISHWSDKDVSGYMVSINVYFLRFWALCYTEHHVLRGFMVGFYPSLLS